MSSLTTAEALPAWAHGWSLSRGAAEPAPTAWGFTIDIGHPGHVVRHVLTTADGTAARKIMENVTAPGVWLKVPAPPARVEPWLTPGWSLVGVPDFLMSAPLDATGAGPAEPAGGYRVRTWTRAGVTRALVRSAEGAFAARGQVAVTGRTAVVDQVETDPAHRRRGLGRAVMRTLTGLAAEQGATAGVLAATPEGRTLYEAAGWRVLTPLAGVVRS